MNPFFAVLLVVPFALLAWHIHRLQARIDQLTDRLIARSDDASVRESRIRAEASETSSILLEVVSDAVERQVSVLQESVKVAWTPQPPPQTQIGQVLPQGVEQIMQKYGFPVTQGVVEHDMGTDPTDEYLHEEYTATHQGTAMLPPSGDPLDSDEPFGVPGLKVIV